jgi:uncharacterized LabA/DUF88 family protein
MDRVAVFVDAGYLYAGGAKSVTGMDGTKRHDITLAISVVVPFLIAKAEAISHQKLLRIYWYDAAPSSRLTTDHQILASSDNVKLRLGVINGFGQQKGVDGKIITDLTELSRNRAFADAVLLGGDEDLRIGVELAQEYGTRVHLLTIEGSTSSPTLRQESDTVTTIARTDIQTFLTVKPVATPATSPAVAPLATASPVIVPSTGSGTTAATSPTPPMVGQASATAQPASSVSPGSFATVADAEIKVYLAGLSATERVSLVAALKTGAGVPVEHDGRLLARTRAALGRPLDQPEKAKLRRALKKELGV